MYKIIYKPKLPSDFELLELKNVCRICLHCGNNLLSLFSNGIDLLISEFLPDKLNKKSLQPHQICTNCLEEAKIAYKFKKQCEYSDKLIKSSLNETDVSKTFEKQTQTDFINFIHPCEKCEKFHATIFSCENCLETFDCENDLTNHNCPITFSCEKSTENDPLTEFQLETEGFDICKSGDEKNFSDCNLKSEDGFETSFNGALGGKCNKNISVDVEIRDNVKAAEDIVRSMVKESEKKITLTKVKVKPNSNGKYECETCKKSFATPTYYRRHQIVHSDCPKPYSCTMCFKSYATPDNLKHHVIGFHAKLRPFKCVTCGKAFKKKSHLSNHGLSCLKKSKVNERLTKDKLFSCQKCFRRFPTEKCLQDHVAFQHDETTEFICKTCKQKVIGASEYKKHCKGHRNASTKEYLCSECGKGFTTLFYLNSHTRVHSTKKRYKCRYCDKSFSQRYVRIHERSHTGEKDFNCTSCSKSYITPYQLQVHMRMHTGELPYKCVYCPKTCLTNEKLQIHMRIHTGERPYKCVYCPKAFAQRTDLKIHHRRHTGERFYCDICGNAFIQKYLLRRHKLKAHDIINPSCSLFVLENRDQISED